MALWFERILGAEILRSIDNGQPRIDLMLGGQKIFIAKVAAGESVNAPPQIPYQGLEHFGLRVKDIDAVVAEVKARGAEFSKDVHTPRPGIRICFLRAPQGVSVELLERDPKYQP